MKDNHVRPRSTSWGSVLGGWLAGLGALAILFPVAAIGAGMSPAAEARVDDPTLAFPLVVALFVSWLIGGYVAGRMAGYRRSWHGLMSAVWGLFVGLLVAIVAGGSAADFAGASLPRLDVSAYDTATVFGFVLGIAGVIVGGWLGGVLSPPPLTQVVERPVVHREVVRERQEELVPPARATLESDGGVVHREEAEVRS